MANAWASYADQVRDIASRVYGNKVQEGVVYGSHVDGFVELAPDFTVAVFCADDPHRNTVRVAIQKAAGLRKKAIASGCYLRAFVIVRGNVGNPLIDEGEKLSVSVASVASFAALLIEYEKYMSARLKAPFGSAVDPQTGQIDRTAYIPVSYRSRKFQKDYSSVDIANMISAGTNVILLGEFGSGKSRCVSELYDELSSRWGDSLVFPFAINLRECWGMHSGEEIIRRHIGRLDLDDAMESSAVKVFRRGSGIYLLDGFDELGSQAWSSDEAKLRSLRASALAGVKDILQSSKRGCLVAGREHYFSTFEEMYEALGLDETKAIVLYVSEEFTSQQMETYFEKADVNVALPSWLPRRPLICQTIAQLESSEIERMFSEESREAEFWEYFIDVVCKRDARINDSFEASVIFSVYLELARQSRNKQVVVGPFSLRDLQAAFEAAVGQAPTEDASVMLQRLPSLGRIGPETTDRQFVDMYILDGLRARDIARLPAATEPARVRSFNEQWINPLGVLGQRVLALHIQRRPDTYMSLALRASQELNSILAADIVASFFHTGQESIDFKNMTVRGAVFGNINLELARGKNLTIVNSVLEQFVLPTVEPESLIITESSAGTVGGIASFEALPYWAKLDSVDEFDSVQTVSRIREVGLGTAHEILVAIIKKTFFQRGGGRKEDALLRGFGGGQSAKTAGRILNLLEREGILTSFKGNEGLVFTPVRSQANRMHTLLTELRSSQDEIWSKVHSMQ